MRNERRAERGFCDTRPLGQRITELAFSQGGALGAGQLVDLGIDLDRQYRLVAAGWLSRVRYGVLRLGPLTPLGILFAAHLAMGEESAVSTLSAAHYLRYRQGRWPSDVHVTAEKRRRPRPGIEPHCAPLHHFDVITRNGLRLTSPARTALDCAAILPMPEVQFLVDEARVRKQLRPKVIGYTIDRAPGHRGIPNLLAAMAVHDPGKGRTRSELEQRARRFLRERGYPAYEWQVEIRFDDGDVFSMDAVWHDQKVILELDSRWHDTDPRFHSDRRKTRRLNAEDWDVVRATWVDFDDYEDELDDDLKKILRRRGARV